MRLSDAIQNRPDREPRSGGYAGGGPEKNV